MSAITQRLSQLGITLVSPGLPAAAYVMAVTSGKQVYLSGHIAKRDGKPWVGKLGLDMDTATGKTIK
jgi:enamine deaminase RidA (YjgF/YER057c/UK114 family)